MLETKYIPQENANVIVNILKKAQEIILNVYVNDFDTFGED